MRIVCPACSAAYDVPDLLLGSSRPVRCARCGREWTPGADTGPDAGTRAEPSANSRPEPAMPPGPSIVERSGLERPGVDHSGVERSGPEHPGLERPGLERPGLERSGLERSGLERSGLERSGNLPRVDADLPIAVMEPPLGASRAEALGPLREHSAGTRGVAPMAALDADDGTRERTLVRLAWAASVIAILLLGWAAYEWRTPIMHAWPASERLYAALGLAGAP